MAVVTSSAFLAAEPTLEAGDRFEIAGACGERVPLPKFFLDSGTTIAALEDPDGKELAFRRDEAELSLVAPLPELTGGDVLWLEYRDGGRFRLRVERPSVAAAAAARTESDVPIEFDSNDTKVLQAWEGATLPEFDLALEASRLASHAGFEQLICLPLVRDMELLEHQIRTAKTVLQRFRGKAMLCDEVGLGKTIEAGLVFSELRMRGLIRSALVLVPPSLIEQWQGEMRRKFGIDLVSHDAAAFRQLGADAWTTFDLVIASQHTAKREPHRSAILGRKWDIVIIDEAHHLRNRNTVLWRFASEVRKQYMLLLTATPVQNNLDELFNLVTLLEPGLLRTAKQFQKQFVDRKDKLAPRNLDELHRLLGEVMVRNRRSTVGLQFTRRWAKTERLAPTADERALYEAVAEFVRRHLGESAGKGRLTRMALIALQTALGSSATAAAGTLRTLAETEGLTDADRGTLQALAAQASAQPASAKADRLLRLMTEYDDKIVLFTQFRATQEMLAERLQQAGHDVALFHGGLTRMGKEAAVQRFRGPARILLTTDAGSEGRNLQFAHAICNFDLPWNPMRIEQRIGRLSRIGQTHDVHVFNLVAAGTVEDAILHLLEAKLNLFELVIGEIDMILGNLEEEREFEDLIADLWGESADLEDFRRRMEALGDRLLQAKESYLQQRKQDEKIFGDRFTPDR